MKYAFYKIHCITNLSVGSGEANYNIVDNQVEKDAVNGLPVIHASGIKGALRDTLKANGVCDDLIKEIFGSEGNKDKNIPGTHKFLDASMVVRPMRVYGSDNMASINVATVDSINNFVTILDALGCNKYDIKALEEVNFGDNIFLTNAADDIKVEGEDTGKLPDDIAAELKKISDIIGKNIALVKNFDEFHLPVIARNHLVNRVSKNLWYEEVVPHGSIFFFAVVVPDDCKNIIDIPEIVQLGGNATIGCGVSRITKL